MQLHLQRDTHGDDWTLGILTVDGKRFGFVCEDEERGLFQTMPLAEIQRLKVKSDTAIPVGRYRVLRTWSNRYQKPMMLVAGVPGFQGIRIHPGNTEADTAGCLLPGLSRDVYKGTVAKSTAAWQWLDAEVARLLSRNEEVWLTITSSVVPS